MGFTKWGHSAAIKKKEKTHSRHYGDDNEEQKTLLGLFNISFLRKGAIAFKFLQGEGDNTKIGKLWLKRSSRTVDGI